MAAEGTIERVNEEQRSGRDRGGIKKADLVLWSQQGLMSCTKWVMEGCPVGVLGKRAATIAPARLAAARTNLPTFTDNFGSVTRTCH